MGKPQRRTRAEGTYCSLPNFGGVYNGLMTAWRRSQWKPNKGTGGRRMSFISQSVGKLGAATDNTRLG